MCVLSTNLSLNCGLRYTRMETSQSRDGHQNVHHTEHRRMFSNLLVVLLGFTFCTSVYVLY